MLFGVGYERERGRVGPGRRIDSIAIEEINEAGLSDHRVRDALVNIKGCCRPCLDAVGCKVFFDGKVSQFHIS